VPLQDYFPIIDDRSYDTLVDEARARIPRYTPEWTNLNDSDPGMTLVQLFAWLSEIQLFRLSKVPQLHYLKFLEMIGVELEPAKPATALLTFPLLSTFSKSSTIIPAHTQISSQQTDEQGKIIFETDKAFTAIRAQLIRLLADDGSNLRDLTNDNNDTQISFQPFGPAAVTDNAFMLAFNEPLPNTTVHFYAWAAAQISASKIIISPCFSNLDTVTTSRLAWEFWSGSEWLPLTLLKDDTNAFTRSGEIQLLGPTAGKMVPVALGNSSDKRYWIRARITNAGYDEAPKIIAFRTNVTSATQAETIEFELVGGSNGEIDQTFTLRSAPVIAGSLILEIDEGEGFVAWQEVVDFFGSSKFDRHYIFNRATGEIRFGNGTLAQVPVANAQNRTNIRARIYRVGGGKRGNLGAGKINKVLQTVEGLNARDVSNLFEAAGGADEESIDVAIQRAPRALKTHDRAVTAEDYEELTLRSANIARAKALPLYHPSYPDIDVPGVVTVIAIPNIDGAAPVPSPGTLQSVCRYLNERRLLTSELFVIGPSYRRVVVRASLVVNDDADLAAIKSSALDNLNLYFHPLQGGETSNWQLPDTNINRSGGGWPFGGDIYYSLLYKRLLFTGVRRIAALEIEVDGEVMPECRDIFIAKNFLLFSGDHEINVSYEVDA
jgi:predicted phage baseplate assembly protein